MALVWNELRPLDRYRVRTVSPLSFFQIKTLTNLYQPLMGSSAYSLYMTLLCEVEGDKHYSEERNHQWLMSVMSSSLDQVYRARIRLEALGLLKTFSVHTDEDVTQHRAKQFEYELYPPLQPETFFADDILSIYLYNQVGAVRYKALRSQYSYLLLSTSEEHFMQKVDLTKEFHEVFTSVHPSELMAAAGTATHDDLQRLELEFPLPKTIELSGQNQPQYERFPIDVEALKAFLMKGISNDDILSESNLVEIKKLAYFYQFDEWSLSRLIQDSLNAADELDLAVLRERAKEWYRLHHGGKPPALVHMVQPIAHRVYNEEKPLTEEEQHLAHLESLSPLHLLQAYQGGGKVAEADLKLLEELLFDYQLPPSVVNLLVEYILLTNEFKLPKNLVTKVAAHWKRLKITNIKEAQELAKREHQQYKQWKESKGNNKTGQRERKTPNQASPVRKDKLPKWIEEQSQTNDEIANHEVITSATKNESTISDLQKRERMKALLQALGEWEEKGEE